MTAVPAGAAVSQSASPWLIISGDYDTGSVYYHRTRYTLVSESRNQRADSVLVPKPKRLLVPLLAAQPDVVGYHVVVVPGEQLPLGQVVVDHAVVTVLVPEGDAQRLPLARLRVVHIVDDGVRSRVAGHRVQPAAEHEGVGHRGLSDAGLPAPLHLQVVRVQLRDDDGAPGLAGGVDGPQALFVHRQVDVGVAAPGVGELAVVAGVREVAAGRHALRGQVVANQGSTQAPLVVQRAAVDGGTGALHLLWQEQHLTW